MTKKDILPILKILKRQILLFCTFSCINFFIQGPIQFFMICYCLYRAALDLQNYHSSPDKDLLLSLYNNLLLAAFLSGSLIVHPLLLIISLYDITARTRDEDKLLVLMEKISSILEGYQKLLEDDFLPQGFKLTINNFVEYVADAASQVFNRNLI